MTRNFELSPILFLLGPQHGVLHMGVITFEERDIDSLSEADDILESDSSMYLWRHGD